MKEEWRRFAPIGLYLSLAALIVALGMYFVQREFNLAVQISLGIFVIGLAIFAILDPNKVRQAFTGRQARYGSNAIVLSVAFIGILAVINWLVYQNPQRWDLTEDKSYTLAPETLDTLESLPEKVTARAFFTKRYSTDSAQSLLDDYSFYSDGNFEFEFIDPELDPVTAQEAGVTRDGSIVLTMGEQKELVTIVSEKELTSALVSLMNPESRSVYFLTGHGEKSIDDTGDIAYAQVKSTLLSKNYTLDSLNLLTNNKIPEDATVIVVPGPMKPLTSQEVDLLAEYVESGGALIVLEEPLPVTEFGEAEDPLANYLAKDWGIILEKDIVIDTTSMQPFAPYAAQYGNHAITEKVQRLTSQFPTSRSVVKDETFEGVSLTELIFTAQQSWSETDIATLTTGENEVVFDEGIDRPGPVILAIVGENLSTQSRVVVFGDSDFAADANFFVFANGDLFTNAVDWAAGQENLINLTPKDSTTRMLIPPQAMTMNLILLGTVIVLPGMALLGGIVVFFQRRQRG
jgi:ABC-type uncharacterized transport system involved in gliding motility auxiliary subunit